MDIIYVDCYFISLFKPGGGAASPICNWWHRGCCATEKKRVQFPLGAGFFSSRRGSEFDYAALVVVQGSLKFTAAVAPLWATFTAGTSQSVPSSTYHMAASVFTCKKAFSQRSPLYHIPFPQFGCFLSIFHMRIECHWFCFGSSFFGLPVFFQFLPKT